MTALAEPSAQGAQLIDYHRGYAAGFYDGRHPIGQCWMAVDKRWRVVAVGDTIEGPRDGRLWQVVARTVTPVGRLQVMLRRAGERDVQYVFDLDACVPVLERVATVDALALLRDQGMVDRVISQEST